MQVLTACLQTFMLEQGSCVLPSYSYDVGVSYMMNQTAVHVAR